MHHQPLPNFSINKRTRAVASDAPAALLCTRHLVFLQRPHGRVNDRPTGVCHLPDGRMGKRR